MNAEELSGKLHLESNGSTLVVTYSGEKPIKTESLFWYALKLRLKQEYGFDLVKRVMSKDGHMMGGDTYPYYLRDRQWRFCFMDGDYAIRELHKEVVRSPVSLMLVVWPGKMDSVPG